MFWANERPVEPTDLEGDTVARMIEYAVRARGNALVFRAKDFGIWQPITWRQFGDRSRHVGLGLAALGFQPGDTACVLSNNVEEWVYADFGILGAGGISAGIYPTDSAAQVEYLVNDSGTKVLFVEDEEQLDKALAVRERCPGLEKIVIFDLEGLHDFEDPMAMSFDELLALGRRYEADHPDEWQRRLDSRGPEDVAILVYTSGTTGPPKGAMITHHNIIFQCRHGTRFLAQDSRDRRLSFLPLCHVAERVMGLYYALYTSCVSYFVENPETVPEDLREVQPTILFAVPRIWEKLYSGVRIAVSDASRPQKWAYETAVGIGTRLADARLARRPPSWGLRLAFAIAWLLVLRNVRKHMGLDKARWLGTGAAPISPDLIRWYLSIGLTMIEGYGQTECTGLATMTTPDFVKVGRVGRPVPYNEVRISEAGEILVRGEHVFRGYLNKPDKTAEAIREGWLHTGDVGLIDEDGFVRITDRMKDIIITAGGKNITPSEIENELKFSPYISDAVVIGDRRKYLTCLIMIDHENVEKYAQDHDVPFTNYASLTRARAVRDLIRGEVDKVNAKFARVEQVKRFELIDQLLTPEDDELTPTMKLKRKFVNEKYHQLIESMYGASA